MEHNPRPSEPIPIQKPHPTRPSSLSAPPFLLLSPLDLNSHQDRARPFFYLSILSFFPVILEDLVLGTVL